MKTFIQKTSTAGKFSRGGFTIVEMMVAAGIFLIIIGAMVSVQIFGLRVYTLAGTKITATTSGRETLNDIRDRIRSCQVLYVGIWTNGTFSQIPNGQPQIGNAIELFSSTNLVATNMTIFYMDPGQTNLCMTNNGYFSVEAKYMTNYFCFDAEDYQQNIFTNYVNNPVIQLTMQFYQWEYPIGYIGSSGAINAYDFYRLHTRITRRNKNNP